LKDQSITEEEINRYLLGALSEADERLIEERYALDLDFPDLVNAVEDELVDAYVCNRLSPTQREQFEIFFLASSDNRDNVAFTQALWRNIQESARTAVQITSPPTSRTTGPSWASFASRFALAALVVMAMGVGLWLLVRARRPQTDVDQSTYQVPTAESRSKQAEAPGNTSSETQPVINKSREEIGQNSNQQAPRPYEPKRHGKTLERPIVASFVLSPGVTRSSGDINRIEIPRIAGLVQLKLGIDSMTRYSTYQVSLQRSGGEEIWIKRIRNDRSKARRSITLKLPVTLLTTGEYLLTITGTTPSGESEVVGDYPFMAEGYIKR